MRTDAVRFLAALASCSALIGCPPAENTARVCAPDAIDSCMCVDGSGGFKTCAQDGSGWLDCRCALDAGVDASLVDDAAPRDSAHGQDRAVVLDAARTDAARDDAATAADSAIGDTGDWVFELVDSTPGSAVGYESSIALDSQDRPHISYYDLTGEQLLYASRNAGAWSVEVVDSNGDVGVLNALAIGSDDEPQIAYFNFDLGDLQYARKPSSAGWAKEPVATTGTQGRGLDLALGPGAVPFISYLDESNTRLRLSHRTGTGWTSETVDAEDGNNTSIAVGPDGTVHIAYFAWIPGEIRHAVGTPGAFNTDVVVTFTGDGWQYNTASAIGGGVPHVVYDDPDGLDLGYARWSGSGWSRQFLDTAGDVGSAADIAIDSNGDLHVVYFSYSTGEVRYAFGHNGTWTLTPLRNVTDVGGEPSIVVDTTDRPHISFQDGHDTTLWYAHR